LESLPIMFNLAEAGAGLRADDTTTKADVEEAP
jgi:hypothetical protein